MKCLGRLGAKKATGLDGILARFVRYSASIIACPLRHVLNLSLIQGIIPDDLKSARVVRIFKKNDKTEVENYRPVSILNIISKVFERVVYSLNIFYCQNIYSNGVGSQVLTTLVSTLPLHSIYTQ